MTSREHEDAALVMMAAIDNRMTFEARLRGGGASGLDCVLGSSSPWEYLRPAAAIAELHFRAADLMREREANNQHRKED